MKNIKDSSNSKTENSLSHIIWIIVYDNITTSNSIINIPENTFDICLYSIEKNSIFYTFNFNIIASIKWKNIEFM
jgi:hypothetical protein